MKYSKTISAFLLIMSCGLVLYISNELGLLGYTDVSASDNGNSTANSVPDDREIQLRKREHALSEKESILKDQLGRYEKLIVELRGKLEKNTKEHEATLSDKERDSKNKIAQLEKEIKELKDAKKKEIAELEEKINSITGQKAQIYKNIYEKMESKKAAKIFDEMDVSTATRILENIKQDKAADILSKMTTERARQITERANSKRSLASSKPLETIPKGGE